ncbi:MAG: FadR/GntR family transcriptional regulator [Sphaerochaeta sp.]|jgi:GntR family transcriptional repressor for pyruvate dehydrogenase complex
MAKIRPTKRKLADYVFDEIKRMLIDGQLKEGDKLPNQVDFAAQLGVSRLPLREAMQRLSQLGVIEEKPGAGTRIINGNPETWGEEPKAPFLSDKEAAFELLDARRILEINVIQSSYERLTADDVILLEQDIRNMEEALRNEDTSTYLKNDMLFHFHLTNGAHNRYLNHMLLTLHSLLEQFMIEIFEIIPHLVNTSMNFHRSIFEAIKERNFSLAAQHMQSHLSNIDGLLTEFYAASDNKSNLSH